MIKFSKMFFTNPAKIWISNIKCSFNNVVKIIKVFNCEWMTMTIDSIAEGSALLTFPKPWFRITNMVGAGIDTVRTTANNIIPLFN